MTEEITFIEETHRYTRLNTNYDSVSSVINFFQEDFPEEMMAAACAKRDGVSVAEILKQWKDKRDEACRWGTAVHTALEKQELGEYDESEIYPEYRERIPPIIESYKAWRAEIKGKSKPESILFSDDYQVAGTVDLPIMQGKHVDVYDFKTNEKIDFVSKYNKWLKEPFGYLTDCKYTRYAIQLSIYAYMLELKGLKPRKLCILWFDETGRLHEYNLPYMRDVVVPMLAFYRIVNPL